MFGESAKRAADLVASRYGVSPERLQLVLRNWLISQGKGGDVDFLDALIRNKLITAAQADEMRLALGNTQIDLAMPSSHQVKRHSSTDIHSAPSLSPDATVTDDDADLAQTELTRLGDYQILSRLGEGGMGAVYLGYHEKDDKQVAIKVLSNRFVGNPSAIERFYREAKSGALLKHPNIVRNLAAGQDQLTGLHYLVMEYVAGPSVETLLDKFGKLSVGDAVHIVLDVARALEHVHSRNIVHRDIKPGNILIGESGLAKLSDLGLAKRLDDASHLTAARQGFGTPYYMPYEQALNAKAADARSDIYALGATLYHLIVGEVPFTGVNPLDIIEKKKIGKYAPASVANPEIPIILDGFLARMMATEPRYRYQSASELIVDLERSGLASTVPSFIDSQRAMQDLVVRQRLATSMQATALQMPMDEDTPVHTKYWFVRYRDKHDQWRKAKLTVAQILRRHRSGRLPADIEVSQHIDGDYRPLTAFSEFQHANGAPAKKEPTTAPPKPASSARLWVVVAVAVGIVAALVLVVMWLVRGV